MTTKALDISNASLYPKLLWDKSRCNNSGWGLDITFTIDWTHSEIIGF